MLRPSSSTTRAAFAAALAVFFLPLAVPLVTWTVLPYGDMGGFHVPMRFIYREALRSGASFLWSPWLDSGLYLHAEGQTGMAHPIHLLMYRLLPLTAAVNLEMLGAYALAFAGMWLLLKRLGMHTIAAFGGALTFAFAGYMLPHLNHLNAIAVAAHVPWLILFADRILDPSKSARRGFAGVALALGSQILLGSPQGVWMTAVVIAWFVAYRVVTGTTLARIGVLGAALLLGLAIGGAQLLPTLDGTRESFRSATPFAFRMSFSLHPINLVQLFSPYALKDGIHAEPLEWQPHEFRLYAGALATLSLGWVVARWRSLAQPRLAAFFVLLAAVGLLLALGRYGGLYPLVAQLPLVSSFRGSARHLLIVHVAFGGLVALMLHDLLEHPIALKGLGLLFTPALISVAVTAAAIVEADWLDARGVPMAAGAIVVVGPICALLTATLVVAAARRNRRAVPALVLVLALDLAARSLPYVYSEMPLRIGRLIPHVGLPPNARPGDAVYPQINLFDVDKFPMWGLRSSVAYVGLLRSRALDPQALLTQRVAGVAWRWTPAGWGPVDDPLPRARLVTEWRQTEDTTAEMRTIEIERIALVDGPSGSSNAPPGSVRIAEDRPGRIAIETMATAPQLLVITERFHAGWIARVDGAATPIRRAYGDYMACLVPAGTHAVGLVFDPPSWRYGLWVSLGGLVATLLGAFALDSRRRYPSGLRNARMSSPRRM